MKVKLQEVIQTLRLGDYTARTQLASAIQQHGIEVPYTPMTDDEIDEVTKAQWCVKDDDIMLVAHRAYARAVLARAGIAPSLDQAKRVCEQAGLAVVPRESSVGLLASMATCLNHGFGILPKKEQDAMLIDMRKLHDEVVGRGYFRPENSGRYEAMLEAAKEVKP